MGQGTPKSLWLGLMAIACIGLVSFVVGEVGQRLLPQGQPAAAGVTEDELPFDDPFLLGQYYFNHDDDPAGPYNLYRARKYYSEALEANPAGHPLTWYQLGRIDFLEGQFDTALYKFEKQREYFGDQVPNVYYMIGLTHGYKARREGSVEDWQQAEAAFSTFISFDPEAWAPKVDLAWVYFAQGKFEAMVPLLAGALERHPDNPWVLNMYGLALLNTDEREEARDVFVRAQRAAAALTVEDWGRSYPGNNPAHWAQGLAEFRGAIEKNLSLLE